MPLCAYDDEGAISGSTTLSNIFIMEYLPSAPADYVKVYLYGLLLCRYPKLCQTPEEMAQILHLDIAVVEKAFRYWQKEGAVLKTGDNPPAYAFLTLAASQKNEDETADVVYSNRDYVRTLQLLLPSLVMENHEIRIANDWQDVFGLDAETVYFMVETYSERKGGKLPSAKTTFKALSEMARDWAEHGVKDVSGAREYVAKSGAYYNVAREVIRRFNQRREPTKDEIELTKTWMSDLGFTGEEILSACSETTKGERPSFGYLNGILTNLKAHPDDGSRENVKKLNSHLGITLTPTPGQIEAYKSFEQMGFRFDAIEQAAMQCGQKNRRTYDDIEKTLATWKEIGAMTVEEIEKERSEQKRYYDLVHEIFTEAGVEKKISASDIKFARTWTALVEPETVVIAARQARGSENPIKYINKLVQIWSAEGITTPEKAQQAVQARAGVNPHKILSEREVTDEEFENGFYADIMNRKRAGE
ncbi:MAG: DnaD domain protein [Clostridia bacterium]|nr:DnaD domain protein [Clostridia bacterium]